MEFERYGPVELVGTTVLDTIGVVIASPDEALRENLHVPEDCRALGMIGSRTGAAGQVMAADEAVKGTNCRVVSVELPRDTKGWGGHGCFIVLGAPSVDDVRRAVEMTLALIQKFSGEVHISAAGHLEFAYSARAGRSAVSGIWSTARSGIWFYGRFPCSYWSGHGGPRLKGGVCLAGTGLYAFLWNQPLQ